MNTGTMPVSKIHGGFVDCYESVIPNNLVEEPTFLEAESAVLFLHSVQTGLAETKFTEARNKTNKKAIRLLTRKVC